MFLDIAGYSSLHDSHIPKFALFLNGLLSHRLKEEGLNPIDINSWGDAIYIAASDQTKLASFALSVRQTLENASWEQMGFSRRFQARIALHSGNAWVGKDTLRGKKE